MPRKKRPPATRAAAEPSTLAVPPGKPLVAGRLSRDENGGLRLGSRLSAIVPPTSADTDWRQLDLDARTLSRISPFKLAEYLADISPEVSRALWDFLRECNAGYEVEVYVPGSDEVVDPVGQAAVDDVLARIATLYGTLDVQINRLFLSLFMRGAILSELVIGADGRTAVDLVVVDPALVRARRKVDPVRGTIFEYGQQQDGQWIAFDRPTVSYIPVDPLPGSPYGRPLIAPALFTALFLIGLLHDLRRVIAQQGYPRYDIEIVLDELAKQMPAELEGNAAATQAWLDGIVQAVSDFYADLEPESAFVHTSTVKLNRPVGTVDSTSLAGLGPIIESLERMAVRALKTTPFMLALTESTTETQANRQFEQHAITIRAVQHLVENQLGRLLGLALQAQGIAATVCVEFAENRRSERLRYAQAEQLEIANARAKYDHGWISQDEAAHEGAGRDVADAPEPRSAGGGPADPASGPADQTGQESQEQGQNHAAPSGRSRRAKLVPLGAEDGLEPLTPQPTMADERDALTGLFDRSMTGTDRKYRGLLDAEVVDEDGENESDG